MPRNPAASQIDTPRCISQGRGGVAQSVRGDVARQPGETHRRFEPLLRRRNRLAVEFNEAGGDQLAVPPATPVSKQPRRYGRRGLSLPCGPLADRLAIEDAALKIDVRSARLGIGRR
jgi:hypothetical protein